MLGGNRDQSPLSVVGQVIKKQLLVMLVPALPFIAVGFVILMVALMIAWLFQGMIGIDSAGGTGSADSSNCEAAMQEEWAHFFNSEDEGTSFYNKINDLVEDNPGVDISLVSAILTFRSDISVDNNYKCNVGETDDEGNVTKEECSEDLGEAAPDSKELYKEAKEIVNGIENKNEDEVKKWLEESYLEGRLEELEVELPDDPESRKDTIKENVDLIFSLRDSYKEMVCKEDDDNGSIGITSCSYKVNGKEIKDIKVEVLNCEGTEVEYTVDFEKYIKGVVFAENRGASDDAKKAQAVAARSYALTRQNAMCPGNKEDCFVGYNPKKNVVRMRGCENDQVYCDPDQGCTIEEVQEKDYGTVRIWKQGNTGKGKYIAPYTGKQKEHFDQLIDSVVGQVVVDDKEDVVYTGFTSDDQNAWDAKAKLGKKYDQILLEHYAKKGAKSLSTTCASTGEVLPGIKFPIAEKFYSANCYSAGKYYGPGETNYHGSIDFSHLALFGSRIPESAPIKIVSSTNGVITYVGKSKENTYPSCMNGANKGGQGFYVRIEDPNSKYNGYTINYWHLDTLNKSLKEGDKVKVGDYLGTMGNTGCSSGKHLHWQLQTPSGKDVIMDDAVQKYCKQHYTKG